MKTKLSVEGIDYTVNENGIPCCPHDPSLQMKREGSKSHLRSKLPTMKFVCPKMKWMYDKDTRKSFRKCHCENPCTTSSCGRMIYIYPEKNLRAYPGVERGSQEWEDTYKIRVNVENQSTISRIVSVLQTVKPRMSKHFMLIYFLQESPSLLLYLLLIRFISNNTFGV